MSLAVQDLIKEASEAKNRKHNWNTRAQLAAKYCLPHKATITDKRSEGAGVATDVFDSTAIDAAQIAAAGLQAFLTSPSARWFALVFDDKALNDDEDAKEWLHDVEEKAYATLNASNFNQVIGEFFHDFVVFPGATLYAEDDVKEIVRFSTLPFDEVSIVLNERGEVDKIFRHFEYTARQAFLRFGDKCSTQIKEAYDAGKIHQKFEILHAVGPRYERDVAKKDSKNMPFYSCYIETKTGKKLEEKGYLEFPFNVGRWRVNAGEEWGYSPAMISMPTITMLNEIAKLYIESGQIANAPPWLFPDENFVLPLNMNAHGINYRIANPGATSEEKNRPVPLVSGSRFDVSVEMMDRYANEIRRYFFTDLFLPLLEKQATAFEVAKVIEKRMTILGAVVGGLQRAVLAPVLENHVGRMMRLPSNRAILNSPPPAVVEASKRKGGKMKVAINYLSPLAIAQRSVVLQDLEAWLATMAQMGQVNPESLDIVDWDKAGKKIADVRSIDPTLVVNDDVILKIREARRKMQAEANAMQMTALGAKAFKDGAQGQAALTPAPARG